MQNLNNKNTIIKTRISPAKINRTLHIQEFSEQHQKHILQSRMQKISLHDVIEIAEISGEYKGTPLRNIELSISGKYQLGVPENSSNIVIQALHLFYKKYEKILEHSGTPPVHYKISLQKNIPNEAGLGGGSSNAAEILKFLHQKYSIPLIPAEYVSLGSDIPFFLEDFSMGLLEGVGEKITEILEISQQFCENFGVLIFPKNIKISTKWAFQELRKNRNKKNKSKNKSESEKKSEKSEKSEKRNEDNNRNNKNDFTKILCQKIPEISEILSDLKTFSEQEEISEYGISGSGSTLYVLFSSDSVRQNFLENFQKSCSIPATLQPFEPLS